MTAQRESAYFDNPEKALSAIAGGGKYPHFGKYQLGFDSMKDSGILSDEDYYFLTNRNPDGSRKREDERLPQSMLIEYFKTQPGIFNGPRAKEFGLTDYESFATNNEIQDRLGVEHFKRLAASLERLKINDNGARKNIFQMGKEFGYNPYQVMNGGWFGEEKLRMLFQAMTYKRNRDFSEYSEKEIDDFLSGRGSLLNSRGVKITAGDALGTRMLDVMNSPLAKRLGSEIETDGSLEKTFIDSQFDDLVKNFRKIKESDVVLSNENGVLKDSIDYQKIDKG